MKKYFTSLALIAAFFFCSLSLNAADFGLVYNQKVDVTVPVSDLGETNSDISGVLFPWFSVPLAEGSVFYFSAAVNYDTDPFEIIPELTRTDLTFNLGYANISFGRMFYTDLLGIIADGLFDGARVSIITGNGNIRFGAWYTGYLYKKRNEITMTPKELHSMYVKVDYSDFADTYFAPPRTLAAIEYDHPSVGGNLSLKTSIIGQFDSGDDKLNSQYFSVGVSFPVNSFIFDIGGCFELIEYNNKTSPAFAADIGLTYILPTKLEKQIKLSGRYSSGVSEDESVGAFLPLTTIPQGDVIDAKLSGLSLLSLDFIGRLSKPLSTNVSFTYFIRNDLGTYSYYPVLGTNSDGHFVGAELFGRLVWNITSGARMNFGTGVFLPKLGNAAPDASMLWRTKLNLILSIY